MRTPGQSSRSFRVWKRRSLISSPVFPYAVTTWFLVEPPLRHQNGSQEESFTPEPESPHCQESLLPGSPSRESSHLTTAPPALSDLPAHSHSLSRAPHSGKHQVSRGLTHRKVRIPPVIIVTAAAAQRSWGVYLSVNPAWTRGALTRGEGERRALVTLPRTPPRQPTALGPLLSPTLWSSLCSRF